MSNPAADFPADLHDPTDISVNASSPLGSTNPTHTQVHGKVEEELVEIQRKLGTGASPAASADENQVLTVNADGTTEWKDPTAGSGAVDSVNGQVGTVTLDIDDVAPTQTGQSGKVLKTDGTNASWQPDGGGEVDSVNGQTGVVTLDQDDIGDGTTYKQYSQIEKTKLAGVEDSADVTDTTNVTAAGALMDSEVTNLAAVKAFNPADYATAAQGSTADTAVQPGDNISDLTNDAGYTTNTGTVTSVGVSGSDGIEVDSGSPVTTSGTVALGINASTLRTHINVEDGADVTDATNVDAAGATMNTDTTLAGNSYFLDEDTMSSDDATKVPSQQSVKAYADTKVDQDTYDVSHEHAVGFYGSRIGMSKWRMSTRDVKHIICWGDSVTQGHGVNSKTRAYADGLREILTNEFNEQVHEGYQPIYWAETAFGTNTRYTKTAGWSAAGLSASNLGPGSMFTSAIRSTNTTLRTITWTRPSHVACTKFYIHWVDDSTTTSGAYWSYSVDGGSTWEEVATTSPGTPTYNVTEVLLTEAQYNPTSIIIRNANAAGTTYTNSPVFLGLDIRHSDYGWVVHNMGEAGAAVATQQGLFSVGVNSTERLGDWKPVFDYYEPELVILEFSNDCTDYDVGTFETAIDEIADHLSTYADLVAYGFPDQDRGDAGQNADLILIRKHIRDKVLEYNGVAVDFGERWTTLANAQALGFMPGSTPVHPTELGDKDIASAIGRLLRSYA